MSCDSIFSGGRDSVARIWDRETGANYMNLESHTSSVFKVLGGVGPAGSHSVLTCGGDGFVIFWDMRTGKPCLRLEGDGQPIFCADVVHDHMVVIGGGDSRAARYDLRSGRKVHSFCGHSDSIWDLHFNSLSNRLVTVSADCRVRLWDNLTGESMATLVCHLEPVGAVACDARARRSSRGNASGRTSGTTHCSVGAQMGAGCAGRLRQGCAPVPSARGRARGGLRGRDQPRPRFGSR